MMRNSVKYNLIVMVSLFVGITSFAQQRTGNIVEYFGKEKVNEISEGELLHVFDKGLALTVRTMGFESSSFPKDPVFDSFLMKTEATVKNGDVFNIDFLGNEMKWREIEVDNASTFSDQNLRSSYVYLTYRSGSEREVIFEASGHSLALINGFPHEGDHYDFGHQLIPIKLKKGTNVFVLKVGRFPRIRARLISPAKPVQFTTRDLTMPDLQIEETMEYVGGIRLVNSSGSWVNGYRITAEHHGKALTTEIPAIAPYQVRKVAVRLPSLPSGTEIGSFEVSLKLLKGKQDVDYTSIKLDAKTKFKHHKKTFISGIDNSVQYYSVAPSLSKDGSDQAMFLSVHGASVEAVNQARAYKQKDWGTLVAPTNRRPFGFAWEDWGRLDALEVLNDAKGIYQPDDSRIYLCGHSMGGHGTWYLGATYPDKFAAIAPAAGYPDLLGYRDSFLRRTLSMPEAQLRRMGLTPEIVAQMKNRPEPSLVEKMVRKGGSPSRTLTLEKNYLHHGVYILHGEKDNVVPTFIAREMRERLGKFHNDFTYYEYPDGTHWYGDHSVDWKPLFDFFKERTIKTHEQVKKLHFSTASPGVSATSNYFTIHQQEVPFEVSSFDFNKEEGFKVKTYNVKTLQIDFSQLKDTVAELEIDGSTLNITPFSNQFFQKHDSEWKLGAQPALSEKGPHRNGGFKDAFRNNMVLVYATRGSQEENDWYFNRASFDAETFWYRANGNVELLRDVDFKPEKFKDQNVILYGNSSNNAAWAKLMEEQPLQVKNGQVKIGDKVLNGEQWGLYFIVPRKDSDTASIGVVSATGKKGMKASYMNHYLVNGTTFPDVLIFDDAVLKEGMSAVKCAGFFGNNWDIETGTFEWKN